MKLNKLQKCLGELSFTIATLYEIVNNMFVSSIDESFKNPEETLNNIYELNEIRKLSLSTRISRVEELYVEILSNCEELIKTREGRHHGIWVQLNKIGGLLKEIRKYIK